MKKNRFVEDDPDTLVWSKSDVTEEEKKRSQELLKSIGKKDTG